MDTQQIASSGPEMSRAPRPPGVRPLGGSALRVAPLALGGNVFGWTVDESTAFAILDTFVAEGFNLIDTANVYSYWAPGNRGGESETLIGRWLRRRPGMRSNVLLATKVGFDQGSGSGGLSPKHIFAELDGSLRRLCTDHVDLYQSHVYDPHTPIEHTLEAYAALIRSGKIRVIGASNHTVEQLQSALDASAAHQYPRYECIQPRYNLYEREPFEQELAGLCRASRLGVIPYFALASGFLTAKYHSEAEFLGSRRGAFQNAAFDTQVMFGARGQRILTALRTVAHEGGVTPAQVSLAWLLAHGVTAPIASATSVDQLKELLRGVALKLPPAALALLDQASVAERSHTAGAR